MNSVDHRLENRRKRDNPQTIAEFIHGQEEKRGYQVYIEGQIRAHQLSGPTGELQVNRDQPKTGETSVEEE